MHRIFLSYLLLAGVLLATIAPCSVHARTVPFPAQKKGKAAQARERLVELFDLCQRKDYAYAAGYLVYRGEQKNRKWKDTLRAGDADEREQVERQCDRIGALVAEYEGYDFGEVEIDMESEGEWVALEVIFRKGEEREKMTFAFLKIKGKYRLGDIDGD